LTLNMMERALLIILNLLLKKLKKSMYGSDPLSVSAVNLENGMIVIVSVVLSVIETTFLVFQHFPRESASYARGIEIKYS